MSTRVLPRLGIAGLLVGFLLAVNASRLPLGPAHVRASQPAMARSANNDTQPRCKGHIPRNGRKHKCHGRFEDVGGTDPAGTNFSVGANGVLSIDDQGTPASPRIAVTPDKHYVLTRFDVETGTWEIVARARQPYVLRPGSTYALRRA